MATVLLLCSLSAGASKSKRLAQALERASSAGALSGCTPALLANLALSKTPCSSC